VPRCPTGQVHYRVKSGNDASFPAPWSLVELTPPENGLVNFPDESGVMKMAQKIVLWEEI
jgi:hypothetical protein